MTKDMDKYEITFAKAHKELGIDLHTKWTAIFYATSFAMAEHLGVSYLGTNEIIYRIERYF